MGWYVDGEWSVQNSEISFFNFRAKSALITNNLVVKSPRIDFYFNFTTFHNPSRSAEINSSITQKEAFAFTFASEPYNIKLFDQYATVSDMQGLGLFFFRPSDKGVLYLKEFSEPGPYNMQFIYSENYGFDKRMFCEYDYLNTTTFLKASLDFARGTIEIYVNQKPCITYRLPERIFPTNKATVTMVGYSSKGAPFMLKMNELSVFKESVAMPSLDPFHANINSLISHLYKYDPYHVNNASLSNVMVIEVS